MHLNPWEKSAQIWASRDFAWKVLKHKQPHEMHRHDRAAAKYLSDMIHHCFPNYNALCGRRYHVNALLEESNYVADVAFLSSWACIFVVFV